LCQPWDKNTRRQKYEPGVTVHTCNPSSWIATRISRLEARLGRDRKRGKEGKKLKKAEVKIIQVKTKDITINILLLD
jgi:hypothetical protein